MKKSIISSGRELREYFSGYFLEKYNFKVPSNLPEMDNFGDFNESYIKYILSEVTGIQAKDINLTYTLEPFGYHGSSSDKLLRVYQVACSPSVENSFEGYQVFQSIQYNLFPLILEDYDKNEI